MPTTIRRHVVTAVFDDRTRADAAVEDLKREGFRERDIGVRSPAPGHYSTGPDPGVDVRRRALTGLVAGAGVGAVVGLATMAAIVPDQSILGLPGMLLGIPAGAAMGGVLGLYAGAGDRTVPRRTTGPWRDVALDARDVLVAVDAGEDAEEARAVMRRHGPALFLEETHRDWS